MLVGFACLGLHVPALALERVHPPYQEWSSPRQFVRSFAYGVFNCIVAQTDLTATWIRQHTFARDVRVIANICEYPLSSGEPNIDPDGIVDPNKRVILSAGRLINQKGHSYLIDAFAEVASEFREWDLVILGDGPLLENLADHVKVLNLQSRVHLPGRVGNVGDWYNRSSIFVLTSLFEGFPNVLLEAMAYGLPVISFDCDTGPSVLIRDCENGFLVPTTDVKALTTRLKELLRSEALRQQLGTSARAVRERFSPHCIMKQWQSLLTEICH